MKFIKKLFFSYHNYKFRKNRNKNTFLKFDKREIKSFYLGVAIECIGALCGGKTSYRVSEHKGSRLFSKEGMLIILIDKKVFPYYSKYLKEIKIFLNELKKLKLRIPGSYNSKKKYLLLLKEDFDKLNLLN